MKNLLNDKYSHDLIWSWKLIISLVDYLSHMQKFLKHITGTLLYKRPPVLQPLYVCINTNFDKNKDAFKESLSSIPGVKSTSFSSSVPGNGNSTAYSKVENKSGDMQTASLDIYFVDFDFINQYKMKIVAGRGF